MLKNLALGLQRLTLNSKSVAIILTPNQGFMYNSIHTSVVSCRDKKPTHFLSYNDIIYPPQKPDEARRPAYVCHQKCDIRYTPKKMQYVAWFIRGMTVDEALKQLNFVYKKGAAIVRETILEAQQIAVDKHDVEFKSNLWVAESFCTKAFVVKGLRRHARGRTGEVRYTFCHYFVRLEEGEPPKDYYKLGDRSSDELLKQWKNQLRQRKVPQSL